ncbi:MAG: hypothetical protein V1874_05995 [Spirochaetota bacterium]
MIMLNKQNVKDMIYTNVLYEIHKLHEKIKLFENKYKTDFQAFEKKIINSRKENFEQWDDYIEWKAYLKSFESLSREKDKLKSGNYRIS